VFTTLPGRLAASLSAWIVASAPGAHAQDAPSEASLRAADEEQRRLIAAGDADGVARIAHPNLIINGPSGRVFTRDMLLQTVRAGEIAKERFERTPEAVRITGSVGVIMGREEVVAAPGSRDFAQRGAAPFERRYISVYLWDGGRWLHLARQSSVAPPMSAPSE
jgi:hypothetical protein